MTPIARAEAVSAAGQLLAASKAEMADRYQRGGARAVALAAAGENAPEHVIQAKTDLYEQWVAEDRVKRRRGAA